MLTLKTKIGESMLELGFTGQQEMMQKGSFWTQLPTTCACGSKRLSLFYREVKGDDYNGLKCLDCTAELTFHKYKAGGFYITKDDAFSVYKPKDYNEDKETNETQDADPIPF